jgi:hypothetical protein
MPSLPFSEKTGLVFDRAEALGGRLAAEPAGGVRIAPGLLDRSTSDREIGAVIDQLAALRASTRATAVQDLNGQCPACKPIFNLDAS